MRRLFTAGTFDTFHAGHARFLERCARLGEVTVALNTDRFVEQYKGRPPVMSFAEREAVLWACRYVDNVVEQDADDLRRQLMALKPSLLAVGTDWAKRDYYAQIGATDEWLERNGITLVYLPYTEGVSSSAIRDRLS